MRRIFHHYKHWEDWKDGLYATAPDAESLIIARAARLLSSPMFLEDAMRTVAGQYKHAAEVNLSNRARNRQAWLGQAACCYWCGANEDMTKAAWHMLSVAEQACANGVADKVIAEWEAEHA